MYVYETKLSDNTNAALAMAAASSAADFLSMHSRANTWPGEGSHVRSRLWSSKRAKCNCKTSHRRTLFYNSSPTLVVVFPDKAPAIDYVNGSALLDSYRLIMFALIIVSSPRVPTIVKYKLHVTFVGRNRRHRSWSMVFPVWKEVRNNAGGLSATAM